MFVAQVKANSLSADTFNGWSVVGSSSTGDNTIGVGTVTCSIGSYVFNVPFSTYAVYNDRYMFNDQPESSNVPDSWTEGINRWYYMYNYNLSEVVSARIIFPSSFLGKVINGVVSVTFTLNNGDTEGYPQLYYKLNTRYTFPFMNSTDSRIGLTNLQDCSSSWSLSTSYAADGVIASLSPSSTNLYYTLNVSFNDYYVPLATSGNTTVGILDIPMDFSYTGSLSCGGYNTQPYSTYVFPAFVSSMLLPVNPYNNPSTSWRCNISGARFLLDNDYYSILHAIADEQFLQVQASDVNLLKNLLATWLGSFDPASLPVSFSSFATTLYDYLDTLESSILSSSDLDDITTMLSALIDAQGDTQEFLSEILSKMALDSAQEYDLQYNVDHFNYAYSEEHSVYQRFWLTYSDELSSIIQGLPSTDSVYGPAIFYNNKLSAFYNALGSFTLVITVVLFGGILLRIIGKVR